MERKHRIWYHITKKEVNPFCVKLSGRSISVTIPPLLRICATRPSCQYYYYELSVQVCAEGELNGERIFQILAFWGLHVLAFIPTLHFPLPQLIPPYSFLILIINLLYLHIFYIIILIFVKSIIYMLLWKGT